jgi:hypothetical protein
LSEIPAQAIHLEDSGTQDRSQLVRYDFSSDQSGVLWHVAIYTKEGKLDSGSRTIEQIHETDVIERVLKPSGLWDSSYGEEVNISIDRGIEDDIPKSL